ncbi:MAG: hypothetical protein M3261_07565 [Thermoproteota archaeon]|nr:hypothetical protein [Thermoproteota archaeon]
MTAIEPKKRNLRPARYTVARVDASVGTIQRKIEIAFGLPKGSVHLILPSGRKARTDKKIHSLLKDWQKTAT